MARPWCLLFLLFCCAAAARGEDNPDFPQTGAGARGGGSSVQSGGGQGNPGGQPGPGMAGARSNPGAPASDRRHRGGRGEGGRDGGGDRAEARPGPGPGDNGGESDGDDSSDSAQSGVDEAAPMDLDGARVNFAAVVEAYVARLSPKGYWPYVEKTAGGKKAWRLLAPAVSERSIRKQGGQRFSGTATLRDARGGRKLALEFVVDFAGTDWKVASVRPAAAAVSRRR